MPYCKIEVSKRLTDSQKENICKHLTIAFAKASNEKVANNIQFIVYDNCFICFRGKVCDSVHIELHPGPLTPHNDYENITKEFLKAIEGLLNIPSNTTYMNILEFPNWGFDHQYIEINKES